MKYANDEGVLQNVYELLCERAVKDLNLNIAPSDILAGTALGELKEANVKHFT